MLSSNAQYRLKGAMTNDARGQEVIDHLQQASHVIIAMSLSATISTDTAFAAKLKIGDQVMSHKAAANETAAVIANGTLPAGISDAAGITLALRAAPVAPSSAVANS